MDLDLELQRQGAVGAALDQAGAQMQEKINLAAQALRDLRTARDLREKGQIDPRLGWFLSVALASAFKDVLRKGSEKDKSPLGQVVKEVINKRLDDDIAIVVVHMTRNDLAHGYEFCYHEFIDGVAGLSPAGMHTPGFSRRRERFTGATADKDRTLGGSFIKKGQKKVPGSFWGKSPAELIELAIAWCELVTSEIEKEARKRGVPFTPG